MSEARVILEVRGIVKEFPGVRALGGVDLSIFGGEVHALVGENGAGKSTLIKILAGVYQKDSGEVLFEGAPVELHSAHDSLRRGIKVVFQELALIKGLSVAENVFLESFPLRRNRTVDWKVLTARTRDILDSIGLDLDPMEQVGRLTVSQQQMVEIARALSHEAKVVIMDEPTSALTPNEIRLLFEVIRRLKGMGIGILYVTHKLEEVFELCDRATVFRDGLRISTRAITETDQNEIVTDMVGREITTLFPRTHRAPLDGQSAPGGVEGHPAASAVLTVLEVKGLSTVGKLKDVSLRVHAGEVVGVFGLLGAGRTELAKAIFGLDSVSGGSVAVRGARLRPGSTTSSARAGLGLLTEDRKGEGLVLQMSVGQNMTLPSLGDFSTAGYIRRGAENARAQSFVRQLSIKTPSLKHKVEYLSGGNQQKVLIARWLMKKLSVIILDEPTRGIDVGAKVEIHRLIDELAKGGLAVLVMTSEMPELLGVSDRILVMSNGRITGEFSHAEATQEKILAAAII
jgi:ribose transport system ATP-binding protein